MFVCSLQNQVYSIPAPDRTAVEKAVQVRMHRDSRGRYVFTCIAPGEAGRE